MLMGLVRGLEIGLVVGLLDCLDNGASNGHHRSSGEWHAGPVDGLGLSLVLVKGWLWPDGLSHGSSFSSKPYGLRSMPHNVLFCGRFNVLSLPSLIMGLV